ncbi:MAG: hypothetical protein QM765_00640 [Myxococcales bacterium]
MASKKEKHVIIGVHITDRVQHATHVQQIFTDFGQNIRTRLGLNDVGSGKAGPNGLILLEMVGDEKVTDDMMKKLKKIGGVDAKKIIFEHR